MLTIDDSSQVLHASDVLEGGHPSGPDRLQDFRPKPLADLWVEAHHVHGERQRRCSHTASCAHVEQQGPDDELHALTVAALLVVQRAVDGQWRARATARTHYALTTLKRFSPEFVAFLRTLRAVHSGFEQAAYSRSGKRGGVVRRDPVEHIHPVVRKHPVTGEEALYVNRQFTRPLVGFKKEESGL